MYVFYSLASYRCLCYIAGYMCFSELLSHVSIPYPVSITYIASCRPCRTCPTSPSCSQGRSGRSTQTHLRTWQSRRRTWMVEFDRLIVDRDGNGFSLLEGKGREKERGDPLIPKCLLHAPMRFTHVCLIQIYK